MSYLIGIDVGTTGTKTLLMDERGQVVASALGEYPLLTPRPGWSEQNPAEWWDATVNTIRQVLAQSGVNAADVKGLGLSGQMHGAVLLDKDRQVLRPAILWNDQRTGAQCNWITEAVGQDTLVAETCNPVLTGFQAPKIIWVRDHEPAIYERIDKVLLPKDYIRFRLTGEFASEVSDASGTAMFNVAERRWSDKVLEAIGVPREWLPEVYESPEVSGHVTAAVAELTGLKEGTPVVGGGGDQAAGAVGNGIVKTGVISSTTGTSGVVFAFADEPFTDPGLRTHTFCHAVPGKWHVMGVVLSAGGSLRWYRDTLAEAEKAVARLTGADPYEYLTAAAATAPLGSEGLIFLPYLTGERTPHADPNVKGAFVNLTLRHTKAHLARAVLEGVAYAMRDSFEIFREMGVPIRQVRASGGGARSAVWRQIQADVTGFDHVTINVEEGPAYGVALLAAVGAGLYASVEEACDATIRVVSNTPFNAANKALYDDYYAVFRSLYPALKQNFDTVTELVAKQG